MPKGKKGTKLGKHELAGRGKLEYLAKTMSRGTHKKYETFFVNYIYANVYDPNLEVATQQYVRTEGEKEYSLIDLYFPQIKVAIEIDEGQHENRWNHSEDIKRMSRIASAIESIDFQRLEITKGKRNRELADVIKDADKIVKHIKKKAPPREKSGMDL